MSCNSYIRRCVKFMFANKIEAMHERLLVGIKVEPCSTSCLNSALFTLPLFFLRDQTYVAKNEALPGEGGGGPVVPV